ncbi:MAG: restriction endonuclease subunit S [Lutibacter sp.]|uniref:restriction endonuclease subunit S n=1 Tax=Lutibacter sp. TaxID=1925666 RepID=UPI00299DD4DF|nr:restriction endonuclease subunit S [Lutibacter sp.]MDX1829293.1 restriction endonuclease subunit S [Lutibacter sp.]
MQIKNTTLKTILQGQGISSGYSFRGKIEDDPNGELKVVQLKDLINDYTVIGDECYRVSAEGIKEKYILKNGDILFISKGQNNNAVAFSSNNLQGRYIASSALFVIEVNRSKANPNYIAWYINQSPVQNYIKQNLTGTYTPTVNRKVVENIPIKLPSIEQQGQIAALGALAIVEKNLRAKLLENREALINTKLLNHINKR